MRIYAKAPVRIGLIGGGSDLPEFCKNETGHIVNCAINLYNHVHIDYDPEKEQFYEWTNSSTNDTIFVPSLENIKIPSFLIFVKEVYRFFEDHTKTKLKGHLKVNIHSDIAGGSGLGGSSSMMVAIVAGFSRLYNSVKSNHEIAEIAYHIERNVLKITGGSQDFYAAAFGGLNFMHFRDNNVSVNKLDFSARNVAYLESSILLFYTGVRREAKIIEKEKSELLSQTEKFDKMYELSICAKNSVKYLDREFSIKHFARFVRESWELKKESSSKVTSDLIEDIMLTGNRCGSLAGKISGAGSGGYGFFLVQPHDWEGISNELKLKNIVSLRVNIDYNGVLIFENYD